MKLVMVLLAMAIGAILTFYLITGWPGAKKDNPLEKASKEAGDGVIRSGAEAKEKVEGILKKSEDAQKKAMEEVTK